MKKVFKYSIGIRTTHEMDPNGKFLSCKNGNMWFLVDVLKASELKPRKFGVFGTGHEVEKGWEYLGTFHDGPFVLHIFEDINVGA